MPLTVVYFAKYLTRGPSRGIDLDARDFVLALKNRPFRGHADIPVLGSYRRITSKNPDVAIECFADMAADFLQKNDFSRPLLLMPVPGHTATVKAKSTSRIVLIAESIAQKLGSGSKVEDILRWKKDQEPTHLNSDAPRDPGPYYENLTVIETLKTKQQIILIDDVMTSGAHFQASAARLSEQRIYPSLAISAARTVHEFTGNVFSTHKEILEDFEP